MNDLAEKALHGLQVARREIAARPVPALAVGGFGIAAVIVVTGGRIGAAPAAVPIDRWFGLLPPAGYRIGGVGMGAAMFAAIVALLALWLLTLRVSRQRRFGRAEIWTIAGAWSVPFALGPPTLGTDVYGYVAHGLLARDGHSPYHHDPSALGELRIVAAIDPSWRTARSTDGPLATFVEHLAVSIPAGAVVPAIIVLRVIAIISVIAIGRLAADLAGARASAALCVTVLNPAVLIFVVSAAHLVGVMVALLLAALLAASQRKWPRAIIFAGLGAGMKPVALVALLAVVVLHVLGYPVRARWRIAVRDGAIALATLAVVVFCVPFGLGWIGNLGNDLHEHVPIAPASVTSDIVSWIVPSASFDDLATGGRIAAGVAGLTVLGYLFTTIRSRPLDRTVGFALLAAAILAPVVDPQSLLWGVLCLAPTALGARRDWVIALSCAACVLTPVGLGQRGADYATIAALCLIGLVLVSRLLVRRHNALLTGGQVSVGG
jgi:alpha-1,6-mannosyltransferase